MTHSIIRSKIGYTALGFALVFWLSAQIGFSAEPSFYSGKTINIIAGFAPGGTIDIRARLFARYLSKYIAGNPNIVVQNTVGAGGLVAANHVFSVAKPDGLTLLHFPSSTVMNTFLTSSANVRYDIRQVPIIWLGSDSWLTVSNPNTTGLKKAHDILKTSTPIARWRLGSFKLEEHQTQTRIGALWCRSHLGKRLQGIVGSAVGI